MDEVIHEFDEEQVRVAPAPRCGGVRRLVRRLALALTGFAVLAAFAPAGAEVTNPHGLAVIIGNKSYTRGVPPVDYAHRDAQAFKRYVIDVLGFDPDNIIHLEDATRRQLFDVFGSPSATMSDLQARLTILAPEGGSDVIVYYSGHGVPGKEGGASMLPSNIAPYEAETESYPLALLYEKLGALRNTKTVRVFVEACFSGSSDGGRLEGVSPVYQEPAYPESVTDNMVILTAVTGKQLATWDRSAGHGLFTHHLLDALYGKGDADGNGEVTAGEAKAYLDRHMTANAWLHNRRHQNAVLTTRRLEELALASAGVGGEFPQRPGLAGSGAVSGSPDAKGEAEAEPLKLTHADKKLVQQGLLAAEHDIGAADGVFGPRTEAGILAFQKKKGWPETGKLTSEQAEALMELGKEWQAERRRQEEAERLEREREQAANEEAERLERERVVAPGDHINDCPESGCPMLVVVPPGTFQMPSGHRVTIGEAIAVGMYEVTFSEWDACHREGGCSHNPKDLGWGRDNRPTIRVSYKDAQQYIGWLSKKTGKRYRLLSESEWEYTTRREHRSRENCLACGMERWDNEKSSPVGSHAANPLGLHDVHGNVWEWIEDCWRRRIAESPPDGSAWTSGDERVCSRRVVRGGLCCPYSPSDLRSNKRNGLPFEQRLDYVGFRVARTLD